MKLKGILIMSSWMFESPFIRVYSDDKTTHKDYDINALELDITIDDDNLQITKRADDLWDGCIEELSVPPL